MWSSGAIALMQRPRASSALGASARAVAAISDRILEAWVDPPASDGREVEEG